MPKYTVFFTYAVDGQVIVQARDEEEAIRLTEAAWESHNFDSLSPAITDAGDLEVLYTKKRPSTTVSAKSV